MYCKLKLKINKSVSRRFDKNDKKNFFEYALMFISFLILSILLEKAKNNNIV